MANWTNGNLGQLIGLPPSLNTVAQDIQSVSQPISAALTAVSSVLSVAKTFLTSGPGSSVTGVVNSLLAQIQSLINDLDQAGIYALLDYPLPAHDTHLSYFGQNLVGGMPGFVSRVSSAFVNPQDGNRPTFDQNAALTGVVAIFNTGDIGQLVQGLGSLAGFFGNTFKPR